MRTRTRSKKRCSECGLAFVEMAISLSVCVLLLMTILDIALVLKRYISVTRIAYEGVRIASDYSQLKEIERNSENADSDMTHSAVHKRIRAVLRGYNFDPATFKITTRRFENEDRVQVKIESPQLNLFNSFLKDSIVVSSTVDGPYLYINDGPGGN